MENAQLIQWIASMAVSLIVGWLWKKPESIPNGAIPLVNGALCSVGFALIGGMGWTVQAFVAGMSAAYAATAAVEGGKAARELSEKAVDKAGLFIIAALGLLVAGGANAAGVPAIEPYGPSYFAVIGSDDETYVDPAESPNARARTGFLVPVTTGMHVVGPVLFQPVIAVEWMARRWPVGGDSSPIGENNEYKPRAGLRIVLDDSLFAGIGPVRFTELRAWWAHASNGQDSMSQSESMDRMDFEAQFDWGRFELVAEGWIVMDTGSETEDILKYINTARWETLGGALHLTGRYESASFRLDLGLSQQEFTLQLPFRDYWSFSGLVFIRNGEADGLVDSASDHVTWGGGVSFFDL